MSDIFYWSWDHNISETYMAKYIWTTEKHLCGSMMYFRHSFRWIASFETKEMEKRMEWDIYDKDETYDAYELVEDYIRDNGLGRMLSDKEKLLL